MKLIATTFLLAICMGIMACSTVPRYRITEATTQPAGEAVNGLKLSLSADKADLKIKPDANDKSTPQSYDFDPVWLTLTFTNVSDKPIKLDLYEYYWESLRADVTGPDPQSVSTHDLHGGIATGPFKRPAEKDYPIIAPGKSLTAITHSSPTCPPCSITAGRLGRECDFLTGCLPWSRPFCRLGGWEGGLGGVGTSPSGVRRAGA